MIITKTITNKDVILPKIVFVSVEVLGVDEEMREIERASLDDYFLFEKMA